MLNQFFRTQLVLGGEAMQVLARSRVAVFGIGGVGGYTVEALARSGVGALDLIDDDRVCLTNVNRQILATRETVGKCKVDAAEARIRTINPNCQVTTYKTFFLPGEESQFDFTQYDYVIDAIDTVSGKMGLVLAAKQASVPIISAMGAGNKVDPTAFRVADIYETSVCPLARIMRRLCRKNGVEHLKVVYSRELPIRPRGRRCHQLPQSLHLPAGHRQKMHRPPGYSRLDRVCPLRRWAHCRRRGDQGPDALRPGRSIIRRFAQTFSTFFVLDS